MALLNCTKCEKRFRKKRELKDHLKVHTSYGPFRCQFCKSICVRQTDLQQHMKLFHNVGRDVNSEIQVQCKECGEYVEKGAPLRMHMNLHKGLKCSVCSEKFTDNYKLNKHKNEAHGQKKCPYCKNAFEDINDHKCPRKKFECISCKQFFLSFQDLHIHIKGEECSTKTEDRGIEINKYPNQFSDTSQIFLSHVLYQCTICSKEYSLLNELYQHYAIDHPKCDICGKRPVIENTTLDPKEGQFLKNTDVKKLNPNEAYRCNLCSELYRLSLSVESQVVSAESSGQGHFKCYLCSKSFKTSRYLKLHSRIHSKLKPHVCTICGKKFMWIKSLKNHRNFHSGLKPYKCGICGKLFSGSAGIKLHFSTSHKCRTLRFQCSVCGNYFSQLKNLEKHLNRHRKSSKHECSKCGKLFVNVFGLKVHYVKTHNDIPYVLDYMKIKKTENKQKKQFVKDSDFDKTSVHKQNKDCDEMSNNTGEITPDLNFSDMERTSQSVNESSQKERNTAIDVNDTNNGFQGNSFEARNNVMGNDVNQSGSMVATPSELIYTWNIHPYSNVQNSHCKNSPGLNDGSNDKTSFVMANIEYGCSADDAVNLGADGWVNVSAGDTVNLSVNGAVSCSAVNTVNLGADGLVDVSAVDTVNLGVNGAVRCSAVNTVNLVADGSVNVNAGDTVNLSLNGAVSCSAVNTVNLVADGSVNVNAGDTVNMSLNGAVNCSAVNTANLGTDGLVNVISAVDTANLGVNGAISCSADNVVNPSIYSDNAADQSTDDTVNLSAKGEINKSSKNILNEGAVNQSIDAAVSGMYVDNRSQRPDIDHLFHDKIRYLREHLDKKKLVNTDYFGVYGNSSPQEKYDAGHQTNKELIKHKKQVSNNRFNYYIDSDYNTLEMMDRQNTASAQENKIDGQSKAVSQPQDRPSYTYCPRKDDNFVMKIGKLNLHSIGQLLPSHIAVDSFHTRDYIYAVGYKSSRLYWSMRTIKNCCKYTCSITEQDGRPQFIIEACDKGLQNVVFRGSSIRNVYNHVIEMIDKIRQKKYLTDIFQIICSGEEFFGLTEPAIGKALEDLPGVEQLVNYRFRYIKHGSIMELPNVLYPQGCARTDAVRSESHIRKHCKLKSRNTSKWSENVLTSHVSSKQNQLASPFKGKKPGRQPGMRDKSYRFLYNVFRQQYLMLKHGWKNTTYVGRSNIQGLGLFASVDLTKDTLVIEYVGELIRNNVADTREKRYKNKNRGVYMFRLTDETVVDATMQGGPARYINHSCNPNCMAEIFQLDYKSKIIIITNSDVKKGEELTYDYRFDIEEEDKIPCLCGSSHCRKWMN